MEFNLEFWVQTAITLALGTGGVSVFTVWRDGRKAEAETKKTNSEATGTDANTALTNQQWMGEEIKRLNEAREEEGRISLVRKRAGAKMYRYMQSHETWDQQVINELAKVGVTIPRPPHLELSQEELDALEV
ncbi:membrane protein [Gordonia phage Demosthenes]|uniref:Uncharacterized protein n=2 Tax=Demosthenesvirus demosthenes TaxID=1982107 RepID=A0A5J6TDR3_9CAUD|nr:membrane protein [Gordonia phage Demosthenes]ANA86007.1 hypothetical protein PBI_DEMOSTHENES_37 [Gordonia phage Demosthenes]QFG08524.1 hypothetical protein PBI_ASERPROCKY_37 [Gordonia phage ASerpRocky]